VIKAHVLFLADAIAIPVGLVIFVISLYVKLTVCTGIALSQEDVTVILDGKAIFAMNPFAKQHARMVTVLYQVDATANLVGTEMIVKCPYADHSA